MTLTTRPSRGSAPDPDLQLAIAEYLAVSRTAPLFPNLADYERAETTTWERLLAARQAAGAPASRRPAGLHVGRLLRR